MDIREAALESQKIQKMYAKWTEQGIPDQKKKALLFAYLDERKRKIVKREMDY